MGLAIRYRCTAFKLRSLFPSVPTGLAKDINSEARIGVGPEVVELAVLAPMHRFVSAFGDENWD